jgi:hypothetical protein
LPLYYTVHVLWNTFLTIFPFISPPTGLYQTAFIVIPENVSHGQALKCSHPICQNRGVRFRYCEVCQTPVAKRNFSTRHNHPPSEFPEAKELEQAKAQEEELEKKIKVELEEDEGGHEDRAGEEAKPTTSSTKGPQDTDRSIASLIAAVANQSQTTANASVGVSGTHEFSTKDEPEEKHQKKSKNNMLMARVYQTPTDSTDLAKFGSKRRMEWLTLLGQRPPPDRPEDTSRWLHQLMVVSDLSTPSKVADQDHDTISESSSDGTTTFSGDGSPQESSSKEESSGSLESFSNRL